MARSRALKITAAFGAALLLVVGGASAAVADQLAYDGDGLAPFDPNAATVQACTDQPVTFTVLIAARRNGGGGNVFADGSAVGVAFAPAPTTPGITAVLADSTIAIPAGWAALGSSSSSVSPDTIPATVTMSARPTAGSGTLAFTFAGVNATGGSVAGPSSMTVNWTTKKCLTDSVAPVLTLPSTLTVEATSAGGAVVGYSASATDETAPATPAVVCGPASGSLFPLGTTTVACSATDAAGHTRHGSFSVIVQDTVAPVVGPIADIGMEAEGAHTLVWWDAPSATDAVTEDASASCTPPSGTGFLVGTTTVTCTATDAAGNTGSMAFDVMISDSTAPSLVVPADITREATGASGAAVDFATSAHDLVDGDVEVDCSAASGATFPLGDTTVECSATDSHGNTVAAAFTVSIIDTTPPLVTVPASFELEATSADGAAASFTATAEDIVDGTLPVTCDPASGTTLPLGPTTVTCTANDTAGNADSAMFTVTVVDTTPPAIDVPDDIVAEATGAGGAIVDFTATADDIVDGSVSVDCTPAPGGSFALGTHQVDCTATDAAGNPAYASFAVTVRDTTAPALHLPATITTEATGATGAVVSYTASADDIVDGAVAVECTPASGATFSLGTTAVECTATDAANNAATASFDVIVEDTTAPTITWPAGPVHSATYVFGAVPAAGSCTATDLVDGSVPCAITGYGVAVGPHTATATAVDDAGNTATEARSYTVAAWRLGGFFQPVDMNGVWNSVKGGSTVPLKFEVFAGATELTSTSAVASFTQKVVSCQSGTSTVDEIEVTTTGGTTLRYDATGGQFIQNWQTPKAPGSCYTVTMTTQDGSKLSASFKLK